MGITEKDIIDFVFYREALDSQKIAEIENNDNFKEQLEFFAELKKQLSLELSTGLKKKLAEKIPAYRTENIIALHPVKVPGTGEKIHLLKYAAASGEEKGTNVITFLNEDKNFLIRLHKLVENYKIFVFSTTQQKLNNLELTFYPSGDKVSLKDNRESYFISISQMPDRIDMKLN
jgi:hypothetical protein